MRLGTHTNQRSVRIADGYINKLTAEAATTGVGKPSVLLRMFVSEYINSGDDAKIKEVCEIGRMVGTHGALQRLTIRFSEEGEEPLQAALDKYADGKFSVIVTGILAARYDAAKLPDPTAVKPEKRRVGKKAPSAKDLVPLQPDVEPTPM